VLRRLAIGLGVVVGLAVAVVAAVVAGLNGFIESNRERIVAGIAEGFARPVQVASIRAGFHGGIAMELEGLRIGDDPAFSSEDFIAAERAHVVVRFWPLLRRRVEVRRIHVDAPRLGDVYILCSDGLSGMVTDEQIAEIAGNGQDLDTICEQLIGLANRNGGLDNVTVVAARIEPA